MTREQAEAIYARGPEAVVFVMMEMAARLARMSAKDSAASTPSGMVPPHQKPSARTRRKKPGARPGHAGARRAEPAEITRHTEHPPLQRCPHCDSPLGTPAERRFRLIEDIPETEPEVTEHSIPRHWCPRCRKLVEPPVPDALPKARFGHRLVALTAWLHYGLGVTISQIVEVLNHRLKFRVSQGGLVDAWQRLGSILSVWYDQIGEEVKTSGVLHADETGWRLSGRSVWLWCFTTARATYYMIHRSRGSPALSKFFTQAFDGVLVSDFWAAYRAVACADRQACLTHLFRELAKVDEEDPSESWRRFSKRLKRLLRDGIRLKKRDDLTEAALASRRVRIDRRLTALLDDGADNANGKRILKRLRRHRDDLFAFLDYEDVPPDNNHAEREIRPAVMMRKTSQSNRSEAGANVQAILMSVYRTLRLRGQDPLETIVDALREYVRTGSLPPLPAQNASDG